MIPDLVRNLTFLLDIRVVMTVVILLAIMDVFDIFSDTGRKFDILIRTSVLIGAGYLIISAGLPLL